MKFKFIKIGIIALGYLVSTTAAAGLIKLDFTGKETGSEISYSSGGYTLKVTGSYFDADDILQGANVRAEGHGLGISSPLSTDWKVQGGEEFLEFRLYDGAGMQVNFVDISLLFGQRHASRLQGVEKANVMTFNKRGDDLSQTVISGVKTKDFAQVGFADEAWVIKVSADEGDGFRLKGAIIDVPEPSTLAIFALGLMGLASRRFKK